MKRFPLEHRHHIDQIPKPIAVENFNTHHLVEKCFINSRITLRVCSYHSEFAVSFPGCGQKETVGIKTRYQQR
jgi:hypothetical protein